MKTLNRKSVLHEVESLILVVVASVISALALYYFIDGAGFAPFGVDGIAMMIQHVSGIPYYFTALAINTPLLIAAWFILNRRYVVYTALYSLLTNGLSFAFASLLDDFHFVSAVDAPDYAVSLVAAVFGGFILGFRTGVLLRAGLSSGGIDIVAGFIQKKHPYFDVEKIITAFCYGTIFLSFFFYDQAPMAVCLALIEMFVFERGAAIPMRETRNAVEFKIITKHPEEIRNDIVYNLKHGATVVDSRGMFTSAGNAVIISVVNIRQVPTFLEMMQKHPDTFVYYTAVDGVAGNFRWMPDDEVK